MLAGFAAVDVSNRPMAQTTNLPHTATSVARNRDCAIETIRRDIQEVNSSNLPEATIRWMSKRAERDETAIGSGEQDANLGNACERLEAQKQGR